jgi:hypothetical protein
MVVYVVTGYVPWDSAYRLCLVTLDESEADKFIEENEPDPEVDSPYNGIDWHYRKESTELHGISGLYHNWGTKRRNGGWSRERFQYGDSRLNYPGQGKTSRES